VASRAPMRFYLMTLAIAWSRWALLQKSRRRWPLTRRSWSLARTALQLRWLGGPPLASVSRRQTDDASPYDADVRSCASMKASG